MLAQFAVRIKYIHVIPLKEYSGSVCLVSLRLTLVPFPSADLALYAVTITKLSYEYDYMLSTVSPPCISLNLRMVLGRPHTLTQHKIYL